MFMWSRKIEREQVAKVTGTNKDDSSVRKPVQRKELRFIRMIRVLAEAVRSTNSAAAERLLMFKSE